MTLRDRIRQWWSPAKWEEDHPTERKQRDQPNKNALGSWFGQTRKPLDGDSGDPRESLEGRHIDVERAFKKPR